MLEVSIRDTGYIAILAVASGHLLAAVGDDNLLVQARSQYNIPGAQRSIKTIGASALSMSIVERAPIQITGYEHYNCWFHEWKCASAPIFNDNDIPIASLTISSHISCKDIHTLTLTTSCANCISIRLRESALIDTEKRLNAMLQRVLNSLPEAVVAIDGNGSITVVMSGCVVFWMCSINSFSMVLSPHQANLTSLSAGGASCSVPAIPNWPGICGTISTTFSSSATYSMVVTAFVGTRADLTV